MYGYVISDVSNLGTEITQIDFGDVYDACTQLTRLAGQCPCPLRDSGECMETVVMPQLPQSFLGPMNTVYHVDAPTLSRKAYQNLDGFVFVKTGYTTNVDFEQAERPYPLHDFSVVEARKDTYKKRASRRKSDSVFINTECNNCAATKYCFNNHRHCSGAFSEEEAYAHMELDHVESGFDQMSGFTADQRNYLIRMASRRVQCNAITRSSRFTDSVLAGFARTGVSWGYRVAAENAPYTRYAVFTDYQSLYDSLRSGVLVRPDAATAEEIPRKHLLYPSIATTQVASSLLCFRVMPSCI